jgi:hypothetical protein
MILDGQATLSGTPADLLASQDLASGSQRPDLRSLPDILLHMNDTQLSQAHELTSAVKAFREKGSGETMFSQLKKVAPGFQGQLLDFNLDDKFLRIYLKENPDPPDEIYLPKVKESDTIYPRDADEAKALDSTLTEASNRLLSASAYLLEALASVKEDAEPRLSEMLFRALCLTASSTSMIEVERLLRPGDRPRVKDQTARGNMPSVIQEIRRSAPKADTEPRNDEPRTYIRYDEGGVSFKTKRRQAPSFTHFTSTFSGRPRGRSPLRRPMASTYRRGGGRGLSPRFPAGFDDFSTSASRSRSP